MKQYTNVSRERNSSEFAQVEPDYDGSIALFKATTATPSIAGTIVPMVKGSVRVSQPSAVDPCDPGLCKGTVTQAILVEFNIKRGEVETLEALRDEVVRLLDEAIANYHFADGIVPPVSAIFAETE